MLKKVSSVSIANRVMNNFLKKKFGNEFTLKIDAIRYYNNRDPRNIHEYIEKIVLITPKTVELNTLIKIRKYLLEKFNDFSQCFDNNNYRKIEGLVIMIKARK